VRLGTAQLPRRPDRYAMTESHTSEKALRNPWPSAQTIVAAVAVIALLYTGRQFFVPVATAILFNAVLRPPVRWLERRGISTPVGATAVLVTALAALAVTVLALSSPVQDFAARIPESVAAAQTKLARLRRPFEQITRVTTQLENAGRADTSGMGEKSADGPSAEAPRAETPKAPGLLARVLGTTTSVLTMSVEVILLLWLLLASGDLFREKLLRLHPIHLEKRVASRVISETEGVVAGYMIATALINLGQAVAVGLALWALGMPNPVLWGVLTFCFEFIPFLGGALMVAMLTIVAFTSFDGLGHILAAPGSYLAITTLQNNLVSPLVYGRRLRLNPVAVLIGVLFWWALWGIPGAFLAVPIIATAKVLGDRVPRVRPLGEFLGA
jgi:predicted PurR-regulated permease PerM